MTKNEKRQLLRHIAIVHERAFRRGFQHGFAAGRGDLGAPIPTEEQIAAWRFAANAEAASVCPPGSHLAGFRMTLLQRLSIEVTWAPGESILTDLLEDFPVPPFRGWRRK